MAALQQSRFSVYDLQGFRRTQESLEQLLIRKDYRLSEPTLQEKLTQPNKTQQKRKEELLTKACQELDLPSIIFEFKSIDLVNDRVAIEALARVAIQEQKNILDLMLSVRVNRKIVELLEKEAAQIFAYNEQLKAAKLEIAALLAQEGNEAFFRNQNALSTSKMQLEAQLFAMRQNIHNESITKLNDILKQVEKLAKQYTDTQEMREKNHARHHSNMSNNINNIEIDGQKVFSQEDNTNLVKLYEEKNDIKNEMEAIEEETKELAQAKQGFKQRRDSCIAEQQQLIEDIGEQWVQALKEDAQAEIEEHIVEEEEKRCSKELDEISNEKDDLQSKMSKQESQVKTQLMKKIDDLSIKELRLQEKLADLRIRKEEMAIKRQEKLKKFLDSSSNTAILLLKVGRLKQLKAEEKKLNAKIQEAEERMIHLETKKEALSQKFNQVLDSIETTIDKAKSLIRNVFISKRKLAGLQLNELKQDALGDRATPAMPAELDQKLKEVDKLQQNLEDESEVSRQEDNAYAEHAAQCAAQMHDLSACAAAVAAVGASCDAQIGNVAPHSQHKAAVTQFQNKENAAVGAIHAAVGAAVGASMGASLQARIG